MCSYFGNNFLLYYYNIKKLVIKRLLKCDYIVLSKCIPVICKTIFFCILLNFTVINQCSCMLYCIVFYVIFMLQSHFYRCPQFPVGCPNRCDPTKIAHEDIECHMREHCPSVSVPCPFRHAGCKHAVRVEGYKWTNTNSFK